jgi:hypothetical protein
MNTIEEYNKQAKWQWRFSFWAMIANIAIAVFTSCTALILYFQFRPLIFPSKVVSEYNDVSKKYIINITFRNESNNYGEAWINYILLSTKEEPREKIVENTINVAPDNYKKIKVKVFPKDTITIPLVINERIHKGDMDKTYDHVHLLVLCKSSFLKIPLHVEKAYYWDKQRSSELVEKTRYHYKYKPVFDFWFDKLKNSPNEQ